MDFLLVDKKQVSTSNLSGSGEADRKEACSKEIVLSIISAARKKRQTSLDSPDLSDRTETTATPATTTTTMPATVAAPAKASMIAANIPSGSAHSLVELGSTGGQPALPVEASEFRGEVLPTAPERKRSASLGGESVLPPPPSMAAAAAAGHELAGITEIPADASQSPGQPEFRSRTSSGSFVNKIHPIDAAGIRSYSGLSAVCQERIRLFEQVIFFS